MLAGLAVVLVMLGVMVGWHYFYPKPHKHQPDAVSVADFDGLQQFLADQVRAKFDLGTSPVAVAPASFDVGTLLDPMQAWPSDYDDCKPAPLPPPISAGHLFPSYQLNSSTAVSTTLGSDALQGLTDTSLKLAHQSKIVYSIDDVQVQLMDVKTVEQVTGKGACGTYLAAHPGVRLIRGIVTGKISFQVITDNPSAMSAKLPKLVNVSVTDDPDSSTVTVADEQSSEILQMLAVFSPPPAAAPADASAVKVPAPVMMPAMQLAPASAGGGAAPVLAQPTNEAAPLQPLPPAVPPPTPAVPAVARVYLQQDANDDPNAGAKLATELQATWPAAKIEPKIEKVPSARMPTAAQVRFFNAGDAAIAAVCQDHLKSLGINARVVRIGLTAPQQQLEVWLPKVAH